MAAAIADTLFDCNRSESEKLRLIQDSFLRSDKKLLDDEKKEILNRLRSDTRLTKLSVAFANAARDAAFATEELLGDNILSSQQVISQFKWLYSPELLLNEQTFPALFSKLSNSAKLRILFVIGKHLEDTELGDRLWTLISERHFPNFSNRLLAACSNELIIRELTTNRHAKLTNTQLLIILRKRFNSGLELFESLVKLRKEGRLKQSFDTEASLDYILLKDFEKGFKIALANEISFPLGANRTRAFFKILPELTDFIGLETLVKYSLRLHVRSFRRYAPIEFYMKCFVYHNKDIKAEYQAGASKILSWLDHLPKGKRLQFLEALYLEKYGKRIIDVPEKVFPEMLYLLDEKEQTDIVMKRLNSQEFGYARDTPNDEAKYFWIAMLPPAEAFGRLKQLVRTEGRKEVRRILYQLILWSAIYKRDQAALVRHLSFVVERSRNEETNIRDRFLEIMTRFYDSTKRVSIDLWPTLKQLFEMILLNKEASRILFGLIFAALKKIPVDSHDMIEDVARILFRCHLQIQWGLTLWYLFEGVHKKARKIVIDVMLKEQEAILESNASSGYDKVPHLWRLYEAIHHLNVPVDFQQFPSSVAFLKYIVLSSEKKVWYMNEEHTVDIAYDLVKQFLSGGDVRKRQKTEYFSLTDFKKKVYKTADVSDIRLENLLESRTHCDSVFLRRVVELLAMTGGTRTDYQQEALMLSTKSTHRDAAIMFLAMYMPPDEFKTHFSQFYPTEPTVNPGECDTEVYFTQQALIKSIKALENVRVGLEMLSQFMQGDYLKFSVGAFNYYCSKASYNVVVPYLAGKLDNCPVSMRKHFLRWFFIYAPEDDAKIRELVKAETNGTIKLTLLAAAYRLVAIRGEAGWPILHSCLDAVRPEDRQTFDFLFVNLTIDSELSEHLPDLFTKLLKLADVEKMDFYYNCVYERLTSSIYRLPTDFTRDIFLGAWEFDLEKFNEVKLYVVSFVFDRFPQNLGIFQNQLKTVLNRRDTLGLRNVHSIIDLICNQCISEKSYVGRDSSRVLDTLCEELLNYVDQFFTKIVHIRLMRALVDVIPANFANATDGTYITEFTSRGAAIIDDFLTKYGSNLMTFLDNHLNSIAESFSSQKFNYGWYMLQSYSNELSASRKMIIMHSLPYKGITGKDHPKCQAVLDQILQEQDPSLKIIINYWN